MIWYNKIDSFEVVTLQENKEKKVEIQYGTFSLPSYSFSSILIGITSQKGIERMILNFQTSQTRVSKFPNVSINGNLLGFTVKSCQNF
jgi:hypothetical protein